MQLEFDDGGNSANIAESSIGNVEKLSFADFLLVDLARFARTGEPDSDEDGKDDEDGNRTLNLLNR